MALRAVIVRADGALVETDELQRLAFCRLVADMGFDWDCSRAEFGALVDAPSRALRLDRFIRKNFQYSGAATDLPSFIGAMQRRLDSFIGDVILEKAVSARPGLRELFIAARADGLKLALVSGLEGAELGALLREVLGPQAEHFDAIVSGSGGAGQIADLYRAACERLGLEAAQCLAIEATEDGLKAAQQAGLPVLITRGLYAPRANFAEAQFVIDALPNLLSGSQPGSPGPITAAGRDELIGALHRLHAGIFDLEGVMNRSEEMKVSQILKNKGNAVKSIGASETIWALTHRLKSDAIGALVVMRPDGSIEGIISERDVARGLAEHGSNLPGKLVSDLMTKAVITCSPDDSVAGASRVMTQRRIRHLPVVEAGKVVGLISIGDVLGHRLDQMQIEVNVLRDYAIAKS